MRDLLTGLAIILVVVLTTLLVAPYFVDWNNQRGFMEAQLSRALGQRVTIGGDIDLKLLPTPYLRLNDTVIGADDAALRVGIRHLDFELAVAPLLHGEIDIVEGRLEQPTMRLALQPGRTLPALPSLPALQLDVRLERIAIVDGALALFDPQTGRTVTADHLDAAVEAPSLGGPYKGSGTQGQGAARTKFRFSTAPARGSGALTRTRLRFAAEETGAHPALDLDGEVTLSPAGADRVAARFGGSLAASGHLRPDGRAAVGWRLSGPLKLDAAAASFGSGELRIGGGDNDLVFAAEAQADLGAHSATSPAAPSAPAPSAQLRLVARQLDVDRLAAPPATPATPATSALPAAAPMPRLPTLAALRGFAAAATPPLPLAIEASVDQAIWGGQALSDLKARFTLGAATAQPIQVEGDGPGGLHVVLDDRGGGAAGRIELSAADLPLAYRFVRDVAPEGILPDAAAPPFRQGALAGRFAIRDGAAILDDLTLRLDRSTLRGSARITAPERPDAPLAVSADLATALLDIDALPDLSSVLDPAAPSGPALDLALKLDADAVAVAQAGSGPLSLGRLHLVGRRSAGRLGVDALDVDDVGGARLRAKGTATGSNGGTDGSLDLDVDAPRLEGAVALLRQLVPGRAVEALSRRAGALAPAKLHLAAALSGTAKGKLAATRLDVAGRLAATTLDVHLAPGQGGMRLRATADSADGRALLQQVGLPVAPVEGAAAPRAVGAGHLALDGSGPLDGPLDTKVAASFGGSRLAVDGSFQLFGAGRGGSGALDFASPDAMPLLQSLGLVSRDAPALLPATFSGGLALSQTGIAVSDLKGSIGGGGVAGTLRWSSVAGAAPDAPALTGSLDLDRLALPDLAALVLGPSRPARSAPAAKSGAPAGATIWSAEPFAAAATGVPRGLVTLRARTLDLGPWTTGRDASLDVAVAPDALGIAHLAATVGGGSLQLDGTLRRDGAQAALAGTVTMKGVALDIPAARAAVSGTLTLAGGGTSPLGLVASLAGSGGATLSNTVLPGFEPKALAGVLADAESDALAVDAESIKRAFAAANGGASGAALDLGALRLPLSLASGVVTLGPQPEATRAGPIAAVASASYDLRRLSGSLSVVEMLRSLPKDWSGPPPSLTVTEDGLPGAMRRSLDVGDFVNAVAARAIARETARIELFEFDVRERALFNARQVFDRRREQDRLKSEAEAKAAAAAAEIARRARAEADAGGGANDAGPLRLPLPPPLPSPLLPQAPSARGLVDPSAAGRY